MQTQDDEDDASGTEVYRLILEGKVKFPEKFHNKIMMDLIKRLLQRQSFLRLGNLNDGAEGIKKHRWFGSVDWDKLLRRESMDVPFKPTINSKLDCANFEEVIVDESPPEEASWWPEGF